MKRFALAVLLIAVIAVPASFAQLAVGFSGAVHNDTELSLSNTFNRLKYGDGIFWGPLVEYGFKDFAFGLSMNFSFYEEDWGAFDSSTAFMIPFVDYDVDLYFQYHVLGYRSMLDPFLEAGFGQVGKDFAADEFDPDPENPLYATNYFDLGVGVGVNLGPLGMFWKLLYMFPGDPVETETTVTVTDEWGVDHSYSMTTYLAEYPLRKLKMFLGAKYVF